MVRIQTGSVLFNTVSAGPSAAVGIKHKVASQKLMKGREGEKKGRFWIS